MGVTVRMARESDAAMIARLVDMASEGVARWFWSKLAQPDEDPLAVGERHSASDDSDHSWRRTMIAEVGGVAAGGLSSYLLPDIVEPLGEEANPMMAVARSLEARAPGTRHVYQVATLPEFRRRGVARALLAEAERAAGHAGMSLLVMDRNAAASALYRTVGYVEAARARMPVLEAWENPSKALVLMVKPAGS